MGLGFYHSGVQIDSREWSYGGGGVFSDEPLNAGGARFRESIDMGEFVGTSRDLDAVLDELRSKFKGADYNILLQNCNSFAEALCLRLLGRSIPPWVNRMAYLGSLVSCLLPQALTNQSSPVGGATASSSSSQPRIAAQPFLSGKGNKLGGVVETASNSTTTISGADSEERREKMRQERLLRFAK